MAERCCIYIRVSTADQDPEKYKEDCIKFAEEQGYEIVDIIMEKVSGFKDITREGYEEVIERAKNGEFKHIIVWDMSRWTRKDPLTVMKEMRELKENYNIQIHSVKERILEFLNKEDDEMAPIYRALYDFLVTIITWQNNRDSLIKSERVKLAYERKKKLAENLGRKVRWGRKKITETRNIDVKKIYEEYQQPGMTLRKLARKYKISRETIRHLIKEYEESIKDGTRLSDGLEDKRTVHKGHKEIHKT